VPARFEHVGRFAEGLAAASSEGWCGFIDRQGRAAITLSEDPISADCVFSQGLAAVRLPVRDPLPPGTRCTSCQRPLAGFRFGDPCPDCGQLVDSPVRWGYIDRDGNVAIPPRFEEALPFQGGLAAVKVITDSRPRWGFIDKSGAFVVPARFAYASPNGFHDGLSAVCLPKRNAKDGGDDEDAGPMAYIDGTGKMIWTEP
jgi:hypothetical protein